MTACAAKKTCINSFCEFAEKIDFSDEELKTLSRENKEKILLYNCACVGDKETCYNINKN